MSPHVYSCGERVLLRVRKGKREAWKLATFHAMQTRSRVVVSVDWGRMDEEPLRLVDLKSIRPYYDEPAEQQRRAKNAARKYKMGVRMFRLASPTGRQFSVEAIDVESGVAFGRVFNRKTIQEVPLHSLWPNVAAKNPTLL